MSAASRAFWAVEAGRGEIRAEIPRAPEPDEVLVRALASGVSRGTEALVFAGRVPPGQYDAMRAPLMGGAFSFPVKYGYSAVGIDPAGQRVGIRAARQRIARPAIETQRRDAVKPFDGFHRYQIPKVFAQP